MINHERCANDSAEHNAKNKCQRDTGGRENMRVEIFKKNLLLIFIHIFNKNLFI